MLQKRIVIAGGSGFLGISMASDFSRRGAEVTILSRSAPRVAGGWRHVRWDGRTLGDWKNVLDGSDALVNLSGRSVNCLKTPNHRDEILRSRVESTRILGRAVSAIDLPPPVWVQMSTAHIYGDPPQVVCNEESETGMGLAPTVGRAWESAFHDSKLTSQRGVILRTSFVVGRDRGAGGGALSMLGWLARIGLGGRVGSGTQGLSWIHETDLYRLFERAITDQQMHGIYIASAPHPVSQMEFMRTLRNVLKMPVGLPAWEWMVRLAAPLILRTDPELALYGRYVVSKRLEEQGFKFEFPHLDGALRQIYHDVD